MRFLSLFMIGLAVNLGMQAQENNTFSISGQMTQDSLRFTPKTIKKLYLQREVDGQQITIDSATVKNKKFHFKGKAPQNLEMCYISGFDNGSIALFLEPGKITINPFNAHFPVSATVTGTRSNEVLCAYQQLFEKYTDWSRNKMNEMYNALPEQIRNDEKAFAPYQRATFHANGIYYKTKVMRFVMDHIDSEASLFIINHNLFNVFTPKVLERQFLRSVPVHLRKSPIYKEMMNKIKAADLKVGNEAPDIAGITPEGKEINLSDLKGKYVLLDIWASWCGPCRREFPFLKQALQLSEAKDNFVVLSYSIDNKKKEWTDCIAKNQLTHKNWLHISTLKGWSSDAVTLFNVTGVPYTALLNPDGKVIAFNLRGEELIIKLKRIMDGVEEYK